MVFCIREIRENSVTICYNLGVENSCVSWGREYNDLHGNKEWEGEENETAS
jgi:hypothetical protein